MSAFFKAELKDKFLRYALAREDYFELQLLFDEFLKPNYSIEFVGDLVEEIVSYDPNLVDIMSGNGQRIFMLSATGYTQGFLDEGGFRALFVNEEEKWDTFFQQLSDVRHRDSAMQPVNTAFKKPAAAKERRLLWMLISAVIFSFSFAVISLLVLLMRDRPATQNELHAESQSLRKELQAQKETTEAEMQELEARIQRLDSAQVAQ
ncbi:hypothetical protein ABV409_12370 [Flagellimonas sp. DF-77]|uniref:hypothetical protein n=1 Tax=Flagellimonas algarum TaxID=3230298 RepID=UPI003399C7BE